MIVQVVACLALLSGCLAGPVQPQLGSPKLSVQPISSYNGVTRIINGNDASPGQFPWQAALLTAQRRFFCGSSIISEEWILTAAHCIEVTKAFYVVIGSLTTTSGTEGTRREYYTTDAYIHPNYDYEYVDNDIGMLKLPEQIAFNNVVKKISLPTYSLTMDELTGKTAYISGWGKTSDEDLMTSPVLRSTNLTVSALSECYDLFGNVMIRTKLCLGSAEGHSVCSGDSGGALVMQKDDAPAGEMVQIGITSFVSNEGCTVGLPQGFTRVDSFLEYIESVTGIVIED